MSSSSLLNTPAARSERINLREIGKLRESDKRERSYELLSEIQPKSNHSDSLSLSYISLKPSMKPELKNLKNERFFFRMSRSETNSPRVEYNSSSFANTVKNKLSFHGNFLPGFDLSKTGFIQQLNSSKSIEDLENQWELIKKQHNFETRGSCSPYRKYPNGEHSPIKIDLTKK